MNRPAGYLIRAKDGLHGVRGMFFDYVLAENGVFIEAEGPFFAARVPVAKGEIRGLAPMEPQLVLRHGLIPQHIFDQGLDSMLVDPRREQYVAVLFRGEYELYVPEQEAGAASTRYIVADDTVMDLHSHGTMGAWFSDKDDKDELGLKIFGVVGHLNGRPQVKLRVGIYGYHHPVSWDEVFAGSLEGVVDLLDEDTSIAEASDEELFGVFARPLQFVRGLWRR